MLLECPSSWWLGERWNINYSSLLQESDLRISVTTAVGHSNIITVSKTWNHPLHVIVEWHIDLMVGISISLEMLMLYVDHYRVTSIHPWNPYRLIWIHTVLYPSSYNTGSNLKTGTIFIVFVNMNILSALQNVVLVLSDTDINSEVMEIIETVISAVFGIGIRYCRLC